MAEGELGKSPDGDTLVSAFARWAADERVAQAARERTRERWLRQQAVEEATLSGLLTDLAERQAEVVVTTGTQEVTGRLVGVAADFFVLEDRRRAGVLVVTAHLVTLAHPATASANPLGATRRLGPPGPGTASQAGPARPRAGGDPSGDRPPPLSLRFVDALAVLSADRNPVALATGDGKLVTGEILGVGQDLVTLRSDPYERGRGPARGASLHVAISSIELCMPR